MAQFGMTIEEVDSCYRPREWAGQIPRPFAPPTSSVSTSSSTSCATSMTTPRTMSLCEAYRVPGLIEEMLKRGWLGEKTGKGFYQRVKKAGESNILTLDWHTMEYRERQKPRFASIEAGKLIEDTRRALALPGRSPAIANQSADNASKFLWNTLGETCLYAARRIPEIADRIVDVDRAMRWGFGWELGPFEIWDAIGVEPTARALEAQGKALPPLVTAELLSSGQKSFYGSPSPAGSTISDLAAKSPGASTGAKERDFSFRRPHRRSDQGSTEKFRCAANRYRRRRAVLRLSLQDERDRRRHHRHDPRRAEAPRRRLRSDGHRQRRGKFFRRRELSCCCWSVRRSRNGTMSNWRCTSSSSASTWPSSYARRPGWSSRRRVWRWGEAVKSRCACAASLRSRRGMLPGIG